ncbi:hypothetical protein M0811_10175 [Anaeramoeba ignava]|uniref:Uncharacterized protein n=1 Tax=Anaeramoeba ignava TaxID=1746090 RepID=A0A9Q0LHH1_ANAIG|nr:hypothetical protein M0811_10175 [Anaeramoeba ignava]
MNSTNKSKKFNNLISNHFFPKNNPNSKINSISAVLVVNIQLEKFIYAHSIEDFHFDSDVKKYLQIIQKLFIEPEIDTNQNLKENLSLNGKTSFDLNGDHYVVIFAKMSSVLALTKRRKKGLILSNTPIGVFFTFSKEN